MPGESEGETNWLVSRQLGTVEMMLCRDAVPTLPIAFSGQPNLGASGPPAGSSSNANGSAGGRSRTLGAKPGT